MKPHLIRTSAIALIGLASLHLADAPAAAITAELANKCRLMAIKAYPPKPAGTKSGTAAAERKYFEDCVKNNGVMPENGPPQPAPPAGQK